MLPKEDINAVTKSANRERSPRPKNSSKQSNRDSVHMINEKNAANLQAIDAEEDSDHENLSPLLQCKKKTQGNNLTNTQSTVATNQSQQQQPIALHIDGIDESIDDIDDEPDVCKFNELSK